MSKAMADCFPFGIYDTKQSMMLHIGLYPDAAECWKVYLGWPDDEEIEWHKKQGLVVLSLTVSYDPKRPK